MKKSLLVSILAFTVIFLVVFYSYYSLVPHSISDSNTPKTEFSTERAMVHIKNMTKEHHYIGTPYHKVVKNYIVNEFTKLGLKPEVQIQFSINDKWKGAATNENILARIKGEKSGKALMLLSHYDSAPFASKGASDDAVGVATIIEGVRAYIGKGKKPLHDIIILITDGEEIGLIGAKAFIEHHPWAKDIGLIINFEARGSGGPSYTLMETNGGNSKMVKEFSKAHPKYPIANSFLYSVYKMLPNDTDLTMFREIGDIEGYNFAFIDDFYDYHCATDSYENVDINTVEHQGDYLMSLLSYFSQKDLNNFKSDEDFVFFNFPLVNMIYYSFSWVQPMLFFLIALFLIVVFLGIKKNKITTTNVFKSFIPLLTSITIGIILSILGWKLILLIHPGYHDILHGFPYNGHQYIAGFIFISIAIMLWVYNRFYKNLNIAEILIAPIFLWTIVNGAFAFKLMGASFMIIPVYLALIILTIELFTKLSKSLKVIIFTILSIPGLIIISPFIDMFPVGLRMESIPISVIFALLLTGLILPILKNIKFNIGFDTLFFRLSIILFALAEINSGFNEKRPKPNSINYMFYADENKAYWETYTKVTDEWLENIMGNKLIEGSHLKGDILSKFKSKVTYHSKAKIVDIPQPIITKSQDITIDGIRNMELTIQPQREISRIELLVTKDVQFESFSINNVPLNKNKLIFTEDNNRIITYYFTRPNESIKLRFTFDPDFAPEIMLYEASYNLIENKDFGVKERPIGFIPMPFILNDCVVVVKKLEL